MTPDKIKPHHLARGAIVYVRQSSAHQVLHNPESRALQYDAIDPANRLVAAELKARWNGTLGRVAEVEAKVAAHDAAAPARDAATPVSVAGLADDLRSVWRAP